jgi:hypothetical protein
MTTMLRLRRHIQALVVLGVAGACIDLALLRHTEDWQQLVPFAVLLLALATLVWLRLAPGRAAVRSGRAAMLLLMAAGALGVALHYRGSMEFQRESDPSIGGLALVRKVMLAHSPPALAPGSMILLGLFGLAGINNVENQE